MGKKERKTRESRQREIRESTERAQREHRESTERERERETKRGSQVFVFGHVLCACMCTRVPLCLHRVAARDRVTPGRNAGHRAAC